MRRHKLSSEHLEQVTFVNWFRDNYPNCIIFAIANGEFRHIKVAERLKAEGVLSGVPDICCLLPNSKTVWVEMKKIKGSRTSSEQKELHEKMINLGHTVHICKGYQEAIKVIDNLRIV